MITLFLKIGNYGVTTICHDKHLTLPVGTKQSYGWRSDGTYEAHLVQVLLMSR